jgi:hypothetical protein
VFSRNANVRPISANCLVVFTTVPAATGAVPEVGSNLLEPTICSFYWPAKPKIDGAVKNEAETEDEQELEPAVNKNGCLLRSESSNPAASYVILARVSSSSFRQLKLRRGYHRLQPVEGSDFSLVARAIGSPRQTT